MGLYGWMDGRKKTLSLIKNYKISGRLILSFVGFNHSWRRLHWPHSVGRLSLQDLHVPEEEQELDDDEHRRGDQRPTRRVVLDDVPDDEHSRHQEQHRRDHAVQALQLPHRQVEEVEDEEDDVDDHHHEVQAGDVAESALPKAALAAIPVGAQQGAHDEPADDLQDLDDASVGGQVAGVEVRHFSCFLGW